MWSKPYGEWTIVSSFGFILPFVILLSLWAVYYCEIYNGGFKERHKK